MGLLQNVVIDACILDNESGLLQQVRAAGNYMKSLMFLHEECNMLVSHRWFQTGVHGGN